MAMGVADPAVEQIDAVDFEAALDEVAGHLNAQHARLVDLTITMLSDESLWVGEGAHTPELFLAWRTGLAPQRARQIVSIARRASELAETLDAFRRGELAIDQMAAIASRAPWWSDNEICSLAKMLTVSQLRRTLSQYPFPEILPPDGDDTTPDDDQPDGSRPGDEADPATSETADDDAQPDANQPGPLGGVDGDDSDGGGAPDGSMTTGRVWWGVGDDGVFRLHLDCDPLAGMTIEASLREARDRLIQRGHLHRQRRRRLPRNGAELTRHRRITRTTRTIPHHRAHPPRRQLLRRPRRHTPRRHPPQHHL